MRRDCASPVWREAGRRERHRAPATERPRVKVPRRARPVFSQGLLEVFLSLLQCGVVELFRAAAKPVAAQSGELQLQALDLGQGGAQDQL
jgi:hypothetical protein